MPKKTIKEMSFIQDLNLSDPDFDADDQVDLLLGQEHAVRCERPRGHLFSRWRPNTMDHLRLNSSRFCERCTNLYQHMSVCSSIKDGSLKSIQQFRALEAVPGDDSNLAAVNLRVMDRP